MTPARLAAALAAAVLLAGCHSSGPAEIVGMPDGIADPAPDPDVSEDDPVPDWPPPPDVPPDLPSDPARDDGCTSPPTCLNAPVDHDRFGQECISELDCGSGNRCLTESVMVYDGETYVNWPGGTCATWGADEAGCDPGDPTTCPTGTRCVTFGSSGGSTFHGCIDACSATDTAWIPYDWNCGCREGYRCDIRIEACLPGCSNDRECCEVWEDLDDDHQRDDGEVYFDGGCTNWCDGDDADEYPGTDCRASFECINHGDPDATWQSECLFDSDCPVDGRCLNEIHFRDAATDRPLYPGGMCIKHACHLIGRGCGDFTDTRGECVNLGDLDDPRYTCIATCVTGYGPEDGDLNPCRHPPGGHPYTCRPHPPERFFPMGSRDGICLPAMITSCSPPTAMYGACSPGAGCCVSPKGLGMCLDGMGWPAFCSAFCDEGLAGEGLICGAAAGPGEAVPGVCWRGRCLAACTTVSGPPGANGCPETGMACYPNDGSYGPTWRDPAGAAPAGFCIPACTTTLDCAFLGPGAFTCNPTSGVCG